MSNELILYPINAQAWIDENIREKGPLWAYSGDHIYAHLTTELLSDSLHDFRLQLIEGVTIDWVASSVRRVLAMISPSPPGMPKKLLSNTEKRKKLRGFSARLQAVRDEFETLEHDVLGTLNLVMNGESKDHFDLGLNYLDWMKDTVELCASHIIRDSTKWRSGAKRMLRVRQAWYLSPVYARAFGREPTYSDYANSKDLGPWPEFFQRVIVAAERDKVKGLREVVKEARTKHMKTPFEFPDSFIPDLR